MNKTSWRVRLAVVIVIGVLGSACHRDPMEDTINHFNASMKERLAANEILDSTSQNEAVPMENAQAYLEKLKTTFAEAKKVDIALLNQQMPGLGDRYRKDFVGGIAMIFEGNGEGTKFQLDKTVSGQIMMDQFVDWYIANQKKLPVHEPVAAPAAPTAAY